MFLPYFISLFTRYYADKDFAVVLFCFILQGLNPFFLFQFYTVILWTLQWYWKFAVIIAVTTVITVFASVWETRRVRAASKQ